MPRKTAPVKDDTFGIFARDSDNDATIRRLWQLNYPISRIAKTTGLTEARVAETLMRLGVKRKGKS